MAGFQKFGKPSFGLVGQAQRFDRSQVPGHCGNRLGESKETTETMIQPPRSKHIASRIRSRLRLEALTPKQLQECLNHLLKTSGNPNTSIPSPIRDGL